MCIVKHNIAGREGLPENLQIELDMLESKIEDNMGGWDYRKEYLDSWEFDISWEKGIWWLALRERMGYGHYGWVEVRADIYAASTSRLEPGWATMFGIEGTSLLEVVLKDYKIDPDERKVRFFGYTTSAQPYEGVRQEFTVDFQFSNYGSQLAIFSELRKVDGSVTRRSRLFTEYGWILRR